MIAAEVTKGRQVVMWKLSLDSTLLAKVAQRRHDGGWRFVEDAPVLTSLDDETRKKVIGSLVDYAEHLPPSYRFMLNRYGSPTSSTASWASAASARAPI